METNNQTFKRNKEIFMYALAGFFILGSFVLFYLFRNTENDTINGVMEILKMSIVLILTYFYGSSKGSSDKNEKMLEKPEK